MPTYTSPQDGTTLDTYLASNAATTNYAANAALYAGEYAPAGTIYARSLLQFPGLTDGTIPSASAILSASIFLRIEGDYSVNARTYRIYRSKRDVVIAQATWNIWKTSNDWSTAGGFHTDDCEQTDIGSASFSATEAVNTWKEFALTPSAIQEIVNGTWTTPTLLVKADTETDDQYGFYSSNDATSGNRPYIVVNYILGGQVIIWSE